MHFFYLFRDFFLVLCLVSPSSARGSARRSFLSLFRVRALLWCALVKIMRGLDDARGGANGRRHLHIHGGDDVPHAGAEPGDVVMGENGGGRRLTEGETMERGWWRLGNPSGVEMAMVGRGR
jgi:hypothetical protein